MYVQDRDRTGGDAWQEVTGAVNNSGAATLLEGQLPTGEAWFAAQATMMALLRFTTQWRQHEEEVKSDLHLVRSFTREPMPGKGLQGFRTECSSAFPRLSGFTRLWCTVL